MKSQTCPTCSHYSQCDRPEKSPTGNCHKFSRSKDVTRKVNTLFSSLGIESKAETEARVNTEVDYDSLELDLESSLDSILDPDTKMLRDTRIDDRDFPLAPNIYQFLSDKRGLGLKVFSRQLWILLTLMHEICPPCSKIDVSSIDNVPIDMDPSDLVKKIQVLRRGRCPKCGKTKLNHFRSGALKPYQEFAGLLGQRVGKSTMLSTPVAAYMTHRLLKIPRPYELYSLNPTTLFGTMVAQTYQAAYDQLWIPYKTYLEESPWFCIEEDTKILLADGSEKAIKNIEVGTEVKTLEGSSIVDRVFDNGVQDCWEFEFDDGTSIKLTGEHQVRCLTQGGLLIWKKAKDLIDTDDIVSY